MLIGAALTLGAGLETDCPLPVCFLNGVIIMPSVHPYKYPRNHGMVPFMWANSMAHESYISIKLFIPKSLLMATVV